MKQIIELLLGDAPTAKKFDVIPIVGMGGIGKTTLAQHIYDHDKVEKHFNMKAWVCVSVDFDILGTTKAILESFTHRPCDLGKLNEVQVQLRDTLAEKKFLLVLDDVWHYGHDGWNSLRLPFGAGAPGSKIIVTTREGVVAKQMGMDEYLNLKKLSYDDCWLIFYHHAFENRNIMECPELVSIGKKIVEHRCGGLPLAARALGSLLQCKQEEHEWKEILNSNIWNEESGILSALKLSYLHLPSHLKRCFSYCAIIPKDYEFKDEELVLLWMAESLIEQPKVGDEMEDLGRKYFHELVSRSFFQPSSGNKSKFIMHDLINDLAQDVAGDKCFRLENNLEDGRHDRISEKARHSSYVASNYEGIKKFKVFDDAKCLRTFLEFLPQQQFHYVTRYLIHDLLPKLKCLRELRLCGIGIIELPDSIGDLKHLRYLDVSGSRITRLPDTAVTLYNLQVLFLKFCLQLQKLPLNMGRLVNLRHFDMTGVDIPSSEEMSLHIGSKYCISLPPLGQLPLLKDLYIEGMSAIKRLGCELYGQQCGAKPFPSLERLSFKFMPEWEDWSAFENEGVQPFSHLSKFYLVEAGYMLRSALIPHYRGVRYHLKEYSNHPPENARELFNHRHASLGNAIERAFACCILHNLLLGVGPNEKLISEVDKELENQCRTHETTHAPRDTDEDAKQGELIKNVITATMWSDYKSVDSKREKLSWTNQTDDALIDALYHQHVEGNKVNGTFTTSAYDKIVNELCEIYNLDLDKTKVKNRLKTIKEHFAECYDLFKHTSGFAWSPVTRMFTLEPEVWETLIEVKPYVEKWKCTPIGNYKKLAKIYGKDRETGVGAEIAKKRVRLWANSSNNDHVDRIEVIDELVHQNEANLESFNLVDEDIVVLSPESGTSSKAKKRRLSNDGERDVDILKTTLQDIALATREGNAFMEKSQ
ncbi:hypothetical protein ACSBR1_018404 [Camellia fascicularis]